ncbi:MAG TPA: Fe2+-dependent dioxygenase [Burkholderiaceae bacterium]
MLLHIPHVLDPALAAAMLARLRAGDWVDGRATVGQQGAQVKRNRQLPEHGDLARELGVQVLAALKAEPLFFAAALPRTIVPPLFNRYGPAETYGNHVDGAVRLLADGTPLRTDVSCTLFLTPPDEYEGGELIVEDTYGEHEVKLAAGDLIVYPSTSVHRVQPVTDGERISAFFWVQSMVRDASRRAMLFEFDRNLTAVRERLGDSPEVVGLAGHYHNLLREWAEL